MKNRNIIREYEKEMEHRIWMKEIPFLKFNPGWQIKIVPPFGGAVIRFRVSIDNFNKTDISVYLDCYDELGFVGAPYWEIYPHWDCDTHRCLMDETNELIDEIDKSLHKQLEDTQ